MSRRGVVRKIVLIVVAIAVFQCCIVPDNPFLDEEQQDYVLRAVYAIAGLAILALFIKGLGCGDDTQ